MDRMRQKRDGRDDDWRVLSTGATFGPRLLTTVRLLERSFRHLASSLQAEEFAFPPLIAIGSLARIGYFSKFPHIGCFVSPAQDPASLPPQQGTRSFEQLEASSLGDSAFALQSAACYNVYLHYADQVLSETVRVSALASCFRNEASYKELERLRSFRVFEIVTLGSEADAQEHVRRCGEWIQHLCQILGLTIDLQDAGDLFFDPTGLAQKVHALNRLKKEFLFRGELSLASTNLHRTHFGAHCNITLPSGGPASSSCVGFGIERWISALLSTHGPNLEGVNAALLNFVETEDARMKAAFPLEMVDPD
jgi:hypothetical protein